METSFRKSDFKMGISQVKWRIHLDMATMCLLCPLCIPARPKQPGLISLAILDHSSL